MFAVDEGTLQREVDKHIGSVMATLLSRGGDLVRVVERKADASADLPRVRTLLAVSGALHRRLQRT